MFKITKTKIYKELRLFPLFTGPVLFVITHIQLYIANATFRKMSIKLLKESCDIFLQNRGSITTNL